jgi:hypothetical protein
MNTTPILIPQPHKTRQANAPPEPKIGAGTPFASFPSLSRRELVLPLGIKIERMLLYNMGFSKQSTDFSRKRAGHNVYLILDLRGDFPYKSLILDKGGRI